MLCGLALLAGCAPVPVAPSAPLLITDGQWQGRFAVRVERVASAETQNTQNDSAQGAFGLTSRAGRVVLDLSNPLGQTLARVESGAQGAALTLADGRRVEAADAQSLLERTLGWRLPIDRLPSALSALAGSADAGQRALRVAAALGPDWTAQIVDLGEGRQRLTLQWAGLAHGVSKLALTLIIDPTIRVSTGLQR